LSPIIKYILEEEMKKVLFALLTLSSLMSVASVYAEDLPEMNGDDAVEQLPPLFDPADLPAANN
jgi:hypothetical protein